MWRTAPSSQGVRSALIDPSVHMSGLFVPSHTHDGQYGFRDKIPNRRATSSRVTGKCGLINGSKSAEPDSVATRARRHRTCPTALSLGSDSPRRTGRRKALPCGPPPPAAAGLTAPRRPQPVPPRGQCLIVRPARPLPSALCDISIGEKL
jgi:hypothetical protein